MELEPSGCNGIDRSPLDPPGDAQDSIVPYCQHDYLCLLRHLRRKLQGLGGAEAEDIAQDLLVVALESIGKFDGRSGLGPWLLGIADKLVMRPVDEQPVPRGVGLQAG